MRLTWRDAAQDESRLRQEVDWRLAMKRGELKAMPGWPAMKLHEWSERRKAQIRAIVEHRFHVIGNPFGYCKVSHRGIAQNDARAKTHAATGRPKGAVGPPRERDRECGL